MPQRFLRPGIRTSPRWNSVSHEAHTLYIAILTLVDDYGRYDGRASVLWAESFAVWNDQNPQSAVSPQQTAALCQQLADNDLLQFYEVGDRKYLQVTQWQERARSVSHWPAPPQDFDSKPLRNAAECCGMLPPSPSPSPSSTPTEVGNFTANGHPVKDFIAAWCDAYHETTGKKYIVVKGVDSGQAKRLIEGGVSPSDIIAIAQRAWLKDGFYCKQAHQLSSFVKHIGNIRNELDPSAKERTSVWKSPMA